ncbi:hypothetical protein V6N11_071301 [Hibiscus sabdariffa]|uniref:Integrase catalytic domain-containing protein n=1 Tax=Hibiscus sabdariffa TaxID=183260 RepID=A0ABR2TZQ2_9ROSI
MKKLNCIRTDNGREYRGPFHEYCLRQGFENSTVEWVRMKDPSWMPRLVNASLLVMVLMDDVYGDVNDDQQDIGEIDAPIDDVVNDQQQEPIAPPAVPLRISSRDRRSSIMYSSDDYVLLADEGESECYEEDMESKCKDQWVEAMKDELQFLYDNHSFELMKLPKGKRALKNRWVYRLK